MKINYLIPLFILSIVYLFCLYPLSNQILTNCDEYQKKIKDQVDVLDVETRLISGKEWAYALSDEKNTEVIDNAMNSIKEAKNSYNKAIEAAYNILWISLFFIVLVIILNYNNQNLIKALVGCTVIISFGALYIGIYAPVLEIHAYSSDLEIPLVLQLNEILTLADLQLEDLSEWINTDVNNAYQEKVEVLYSYLEKIPYIEYLGGFDNIIPKEISLDLNYELGSYVPDQYKVIDLTAKFYGDIYYYYQSKSAMSLIGALFNQENFVVGIALLSFSVIIPIIKMLMTVLITFFKSFSKKIGLITFINFIGKWSMADVFVAACFLSFLSFNNMSNQIETDSKTLLGLYFFLSYVIISLISSTLMNIQLKKLN